MPDADQHLPPTLLDGIRVIDIATPRAEMAGRVLADLGAEVIKVEPPGGAPARHMPPFSDSEPGRSLYWAHVGFGKRSVVIDPESPTQRDDFMALLRTADVLIESSDAGFTAAHDFSYVHLKDQFPRLIYASITPYGQDGPHANRPATNLTVEAAGGLVSLQGDGDRPPIPVGYPQAAFHAGVQAAADVCIALRERERSGLGQHLDVSAAGGDGMDPDECHRLPAEHRRRPAGHLRRSPKRADGGWRAGAGARSSLQGRLRGLRRGTRRARPAPRDRLPQAHCQRGGADRRDGGNRHRPVGRRCRAARPDRSCRDRADGGRGVEADPQVRRHPHDEPALPLGGRRRLHDGSAAHLERHRRGFAPPSAGLLG